MKPDGKVFVTGANGLLATNTIALLIEKGFEVRATIRDKSSFLLPPHPNLELVKCDILDLHTLRKASQGCRVFVHAAAHTAQDSPSYEPYRRVNVVGTKNVLEAAQEAGAEKFIFVSTANTSGYGSLDRPGKESDPIRKPFSLGYYPKSKLEAERLINTFREKLNLITVQPTFMLGMYDAKPSSGRIVQMALGKSILFYPPGGKNFVNVKDVAEGILQAILKGRNGESYLLAHENLTYREFFAKVIRESGQKTKLIRIPQWFLMAMGYLGDALRYLNMKTELSSTNMRILCVNNYYSNKKAMKELNMKFAPIEEGISEAIEWFRQRSD